MASMRGSVIVLAVLLMVAACGDDGGPGPSDSYLVGGTVVGLAGGSVVLQNNDGDAVTVDADGSFTFTTPVPASGAYRVAVSAHPSIPLQTCAVEAGTGTVEAADVTSVVVRCRLRILLSANNGATGLELFVSDGASSVLVVDLTAPGNDTSLAATVTVRGLSYLHLQIGGDGINQLWRSDGTAAGTQRVASQLEIAGIPAAACAGSLCFAAAKPETGGALWKTDGTEAGTVLVKDINPGSAWGYPEDLVALGATLYFVAPDVAVDPFVYQLWKSDGTEAGTVALGPGALNGQPRGLTPFGSELAFAARQGATQDVLWKTDGTPAGTVRVGGGAFDIGEIVAVGRTLYFGARDAILPEPVLWKSDGTAAGTTPVMEFGSYPGSFAVVGTRIYFRADSELWTSDGTPNGTVRLTGPLTNLTPSDLTAVGSTLYFTADDGVHGMELWKSDGTVGGTVLVRDLAIGSASGLYQGRLREIAGTLYFVGNDGATGFELWKSDGTAAGTVLIEDLNPGAADGVWYIL